MKAGGSMPHLQDSLIIPITSWIKPIPRSDTYFFKAHSNIVLPSMPSPSWRSLSSRFTYYNLWALLPSFILSTWPAHLLDLITLIIWAHARTHAHSLRLFVNNPKWYFIKIKSSWINFLILHSNKIRFPSKYCIFWDIFSMTRRIGCKLASPKFDLMITRVFAKCIKWWCGYPLSDGIYWT